MYCLQSYTHMQQHDTESTCLAWQVYLMGDVGIEEELDLKGIKYLGGPGDADHKVELKAGYAMPHDKDVSHVSCC